MSETFVIFDLEYTTWEGAQDRRWSGENEYREVVQIAAIKVDATSFEEVDNLDLLVVPTFNPIVSDFFTQLTGITNDEIQKDGHSFEEVMRQFYDFCFEQTVFSHGNDMMILAENIGYYKLFSFFPGLVFFKNWANFFYTFDEKTKNLVSGQLAQHFGVAQNIKGQEHNALYDCRSQLEAFKHLYQKGHKFGF